MITASNFRELLTQMGFTESGEQYKKSFPHFEASMAVDFSEEQLYYPDTIKGRERNNGFDASENFVVFECVNRLLDKGYRPEHIELEKEWHLGHDAKSGRADICVTDPKGSLLFIIECKTWGREFNRALIDTKNDGAQLFSYWQQEQSCKWLVLYASGFEGGVIEYKAPTINCSDDANIILLAKKDKSVKLYRDAHTALEKYEVWKETYSSQIHDDLVFSNDSVAYKIGVKPLLKKNLCDFTPDDKIVNRFEEILRHNNVSDKENAFNRLIALFICKLVDESTKGEDDEVEFQYKKGTDTYETLQDRLQRLHRDGMEKFMREEIYYVSADYPEWLFSTYTGSKRKKAIEDLQNTIRILKFYSNNDFAFKDVHNEELFYQNGKILVEMVQLFEKYRIVYPSKHQFLGDLFEQLLSKGFKQNEGQFFTPMPITRFIWDSLPVERVLKSERGIVYPKVIDYACGAGHFLTEAVEAINYFVHSDGDNSWARDCIFGIEKDYRLARVAKISLFMNGAGEGNIIFGDGLENAPDKGINNGSFDILVANPPYSVKDFKQHLQLKNNSFTLLDRIGLNGGEIETLFVERIGQLLKPKGIAAVILPSSILSNDSASYTGAREQFLQNFYIRAIVALGSMTFGATGANTVVMFLEKFYEPPKQIDLSADSVDAIFSGAELEDWKDKEILEAYIAQIEVDDDVYRSFLNKSCSLDELSDMDYFEMYVGAFTDSADAKNLIKTRAYRNMNEDEKTTVYLEKFYDYAYKIEKEKLRYFSLVYQQTTVIITAPPGSKAQKDFLGYGWSDRKGNEGIQIITPGGKLYDDSDRAADGTLACAIRQSFNGIIPSFSEEQQTYASAVSTKDMLDFSRVSFNKAMRLNVKKNTVFGSKYPFEPLGENISLEYGKSLPESNRVEGEFPVMGSNGRVGTHNTFLVEGPSIIVGRKGSAGSLTWENLNCYPIDTTYYVQLKNDEYLLKFLFYIMKQIDFNGLIDKMGVPGLNRENVYGVKVPKPPIIVQQQVINECEKIESEYNATRIYIKTCRKKIEDLFDKLDATNHRKYRLSDIAMFNTPKSEIANLPDGLMVSFIEMASVSTNGFVETMRDRPLSEVRKGSYTYFRNNDIIIAKITPCMENGKCAYLTGLTNDIGFGSSEFHTIRCDKTKVLPEFAFHFLNRKKIREDAAKTMTGASGHRRVPVTYYQNLKIPAMSVEEQKKILNTARHMTAKIREAEQRLRTLTKKPALILNQYLN